jgi:hypothetical protein
VSIDGQAVEAIWVESQMVIGSSLLQDRDIEPELVPTDRFEYAISHYLRIRCRTKLIKEIYVLAGKGSSEIDQVVSDLTVIERYRREREITGSL